MPEHNRASLSVPSSCRLLVPALLTRTQPGPPPHTAPPPRQVGSSPAAVASSATYTFAMLSDPEAALEVAKQLVEGGYA